MNVEHSDYIFYYDWSVPNGIYRSDKDLFSWEFTNTGYCYTFDAEFDDNDVMFLASQDHVFKSVDYCTTIDTAFIGGDNIISIAVSENNEIWATMWGGVLHSNDGGNSWDTALWTQGYELFKNVAFGLNGEIYTCSHDFSFTQSGFYRSLDNGSTWENMGLSGEAPQSIAVNSQGDIFVGCRWNGVYRSMDQGVNWVNVKNDIDATSMVVDEYDKIFSSCCGDNWWTTRGVHYSNDNGNTWDILNLSGLSNKFVNFIYLSEEGYLYAASRSDYGHTLFRTNNPIVGLTELETQQNHLTAYPNPFTTSTTIEYELKEISNIQFTVYNVMGETVYHAEYSLMPQGSHTVTWSPGHLPEGMYYAVLRSEEGVEVVKMIKQ
jgi:hypothetical protein